MDFDVIIGQILERVDLVEIISRYVNLKKSGRNFLGLCPFHTEKTPSFSVSPDKQIFKCFGCGKGGNIVHFMMEYEKLTFVETLKLLAKEAHIAIDFQQDTHKDEKSELLQINNVACEFFQNEYEKADPIIKGYLEKRGINKKTIINFKVGFAPNEWEKLVQKFKYRKVNLKKAEQLGLLSYSKNNKHIDRFRDRIMFPIIDLSGNILGFGGRVLQKNSKTAKYINSPESLIYKKSEILYGLFNSRDSIRENDKAIFVEGYLDLLQLYQNGIQHVVATSGTAFTESHSRLIKRFTNNIYLCFDADEAGLNAILKSGLMIINYDFDVKVILLPNSEDPDSFVLKNGPEKFMEEQNNAIPFTKFFIYYFSTKYDLKNFNSRQEAINYAIELLSKINNLILSNYLLEEFAFISNSPLEHLKKRMEKLWEKKDRFSKKGGVKDDNLSLEENINLPPEERDLIALLLQESSSVSGLILDTIDVEDFSHPALRRVYEQICIAFDEFGKIVGNKILSSVSNEMVLKVITKRLMDDFVDPVKYANDTIVFLKYKNAKIKKEKIALKIKKEEEQGVINKELLESLNEALLEMKRYGSIINEKWEIN